MHKGLTIAFIIIAVFSSPLNVEAFTHNQKILLDIAKHEGSMIGYPETMQGILIQETKAGTLNHGAFGIIGDHKFGFGKKSYGVMQVRLATAKDVIKRNPDIAKTYTDEEIIIGLVTKPRFCIRIASLYFLWLTKRRKEGHIISWSHAVAAYNAGPSNIIAGIRYAKRVKQKVREIRKWRKEQQ